MIEWKNEIRQRLASLNLAPARESAIVEELATHLNDRYSELLAGGATPPDAERRTREEFNDSELLSRELKRVEKGITPEPVVLGTNKSSNLLSDLCQDLRYGARVLSKNPGFTAVVVLTLILGMGVNTAVFTLLNLALRPVPVKDPDTIVNLGYWEKGGYAFSDYVYFRDHAQVFSDLIASCGVRLVMGPPTASDEPQFIRGELVSDNYFSMLGARTMFGRTFAPGESHSGQRRTRCPELPLMARAFRRRCEHPRPDSATQQQPLHGDRGDLAGIRRSRSSQISLPRRLVADNDGEPPLS